MNFFITIDGDLCCAKDFFIRGIFPHESLDDNYVKILGFPPLKTMIEHSHHLSLLTRDGTLMIYKRNGECVDIKIEGVKKAIDNYSNIMILSNEGRVISFEIDSKRSNLIAESVSQIVRLSYIDCVIICKNGTCYIRSAGVQREIDDIEPIVKSESGLLFSDSKIYQSRSRLDNPIDIIIGSDNVKSAIQYSNHVYIGILALYRDGVLKFYRKPSIEEVKTETSISEVKTDILINRFICASEINPYGDNKFLIEDVFGNLHEFYINKDCDMKSRQITLPRKLAQQANSRPVMMKSTLTGNKIM